MVAFVYCELRADPLGDAASQRDELLSPLVLVSPYLAECHLSRAHETAVYRCL